MGIEEEFREGKRVFKIIGTHNITKQQKHYDMVTTFSDYEKRIRSHMYTPLLYKLSLKDRIGYLYGCLNMTFGSTRTETFTVYTRVIGTAQWEEWFEIKPYTDSI